MDFQVSDMKAVCTKKGATIYLQVFNFETDHVNFVR